MGTPATSTKALGNSAPSRRPLPAAGNTRATGTVLVRPRAAERKKAGACPAFSKTASNAGRSVTEYGLQFLHYFLFGMGLGNGQFLDEQIACGIEHLALPEGKLLVAL